MYNPKILINRKAIYCIISTFYIFILLAPVQNHSVKEHGRKCSKKLCFDSVCQLSFIVFGNEFLPVKKYVSWGKVSIF